MKVRGIVVKIKDSQCLVLASDGTYHKVPLSRHKGARVGSEIEFALYNRFSYIKPLMLVASILVIALGLSIFHQAATPSAFAYVSLDINPSVELEVDRDLNVISAHPLNKDAENLLARVKIAGQPLYTSVNTLLAEAVNEGYLKPGQKNYILSTVTLEKTSSSKNIDYEALTGKMRSAVQDKGVDIELVVLSTDSKLQKEAKSKGLSTGKLVIYKQTLDAGETVTLQQVKENSISKLVSDYKVKLIPADRKMIIKSLEIKPRKPGKDTRSQVRDASPTMWDNRKNNQQESGKMPTEVDSGENRDADKPASDSYRQDSTDPRKPDPRKSDSRRQDPADKPILDSRLQDPADKPISDSRRQDPADKPILDSRLQDPADKPISDSRRQDSTGKLKPGAGQKTKGD